MEATDTPGDALSAALLPVLMHQLNGATQVLTSLSAVLSLPDGEHWLCEKANDMSSVSREIEDLGWLLAVLSTASGSNLLLARREERGLEIMAEVVRHALRREGRDLDAHEGEIPRLDPAGGQGWELSWCVGLSLLETGRALEAKRPGDEGDPPRLRWSLKQDADGSAGLSIESDAAGGFTGLETPALAMTLQSAIPELTLERSGEAGLLITIPTGWLQASSSGVIRS